jgi:hypothetical protein
MSKFVCDGIDCPNKDTVYDFGDQHPDVCECGGCKALLYPIVEDDAE